MLFSSLEFLYGFLPLFLVFYFIIPRKYIAVKNTVLLVFSLFFYGWGERDYTLLMASTIFVDYIAGILTDYYLKKGKKRTARRVLIITVTLNLLSLFVFKYLNFTAELFSFIPFIAGLEIPALALPIGISFYTFQSLSYVIDVYRGDGEVQKNPISFGAYVTMFPQLIAGPIVRYRDVDAALRKREHSVTLFASGLRTFCCGLCKKVLLANAAGGMWEYYAAYGADERTVLGAWLGAIFFTLQIYLDFSAYSDMAIGLGKMLGFRFPQNFNYPYISESITEFWSRWHISLSSWFREYLYIPLGGNRRSLPRAIFNLFAVWFLTGLWHGASVNFVIWGLMYFVLLSLEKYLWGGIVTRMPRVLRHIYVLFFTVVGFLIFASVDGRGGIGYLADMLLLGNARVAARLDFYELVRNFALLSVMIFACTPYPKRLFYRLYEKSRSFRYALPFVVILLFILCTAFLVDSAFNPFLYFRF